MTLMKRLLLLCLLFVAMFATPLPIRAQWLGIPTVDQCKATLHVARAKIEALPVDHISRHFAESRLNAAEAEASAADFDDCVEEAWKAINEIKHRWHSLEPGQRLRIQTANGGLDLHGDVP
jgi:hypothetical protein